MTMETLSCFSKTSEFSGEGLVDSEALGRHDLGNRCQWRSLLVTSYEFLGSRFILSLGQHTSTLLEFSPESCHIKPTKFEHLTQNRHMTKKVQHDLHQPRNMENNSSEWLHGYPVSSWYLCLQKYTWAPHGRCVAKAAMRAGRKLREAGWQVHLVCPGKTMVVAHDLLVFYGSVEDVFIVGSTQVRLRRVVHLVRREMPLGCDRLGDVTWELQAEARNGAIESSIVGI